MDRFMKLRLGLMYFCMFSFIGIHMPFWPVWLNSKGISPSGIATLTALAFALKIVFTPVVSGIVDRNGRKREAIILLAFGLLAGCVMFTQTDRFVTIFLLTTFAFACWSPIMSLCESIATMQARAHGLDYGKIRLWGSVGFMLVVVAAGKVMNMFGGGSLLGFIVGAAAMVFVAACLLPRERVVVERAGKVSSAPFFASKWFVLFLASTLLIQGSHAAYYTFGSLYWQQQGLSDSMIGVLWGWSLAVEIAFFAFGRSLVSRLGPVNVIVLGGLAAALRWTCIGMSANVPLLMAAQVLQALTFGASHMAAMKIITERVHPSLSASGQGLYSAFIMGIGMGAFVLLSGPLYSALKGAVFLTMALVALLGTAGALWVRKLPLTTVRPVEIPVVPAGVMPAVE